MVHRSRRSAAHIRGDDAATGAKPGRNRRQRRRGHVRLRSNDLEKRFGVRSAVCRAFSTVDWAIQAAPHATASSIEEDKSPYRSQRTYDHVHTGGTDHQPGCARQTGNGRTTWWRLLPTTGGSVRNRLQRRASMIANLISLEIVKAGRKNGEAGPYAH